MIGLVIVSHSAKIAEGVVDLARGMVGAEFPIAAAGGLDTPDILGTDALRILSAIESVYSGSGVIVLMDMGSAILSAETALDFLSADMRPNVILCAAPLVEGAVAAAVAAQANLPLEQVTAAARAALDAKSQQLGETAPPLSPRPALAPERCITMTMPNRLGLHARPAARLVALASRFEAEVHLRSLTNGRSASARSFNSLMLLGAVGGHGLEIEASGTDAAEALAAIQAFAAQNFGDPADDGSMLPLTPSPSPTWADARTSSGREEQDRLRGLPASPGIAIGLAKHYSPETPEISNTSVTDPPSEIAALLAAVDRAKAQIEAQRAHSQQEIGASAGEIFTAHLAFLSDADVLDAARQQINEAHVSAAAAWKAATDALIAQYRHLDSSYLQARAADAEALQAQVLAELLGAAARPALREPAILIARDLTPAEVGALDPALALGIATAEGSPTSHSAILARMLGISAVVGLGAGILALDDGTPIILDGTSGDVLINPDEQTRQRQSDNAEAYRRKAGAARQMSAQPAATVDGTRIEVFANVAGADDTRRAAELGAEGVGVLRTEFLFLRRETAPSAEEQYSAYREIALALGGRPLVIRTLDVGGDKPLPYLEQPHEANPFLGLRGARLSLAYPDLFRTQLRAIVRLADEFPVRVMFPMIATLEEFHAAKALLDAVRGESGAPSLPTGMMVEVPAAVECIAAFAPEVDFFSIGTNDLTQYAFAAERGNSAVAALADGLHPALLRMIARVVHAGRPTAVCGELASDPAAIPLLIGLGVRELSMNAAAIPEAKAVIRQTIRGEAEPVANAALALSSAEEVRRLSLAP